MPMYQATCPDCGATITLNVPGDIWAGCPSCEFYGQVPALEPVTPTPLTDEQVKAIRAILAVTDRGDTRFYATHALLAEVERLRAREAALAAVVERVAQGEPGTIDSYEDGICFYCRVDDRDPHAPDCTWVQAHALLATSASEVSE